MHRRCTVVSTQRNGTHSEVANKPHYPMITAATLNKSINMKIVTGKYVNHFIFLNVYINQKKLELYSHKQAILRRNS
jgi:desulfoferrodoxin (superoxide reductase-like protein)